jgi:hypothetical protein
MLDARLELRTESVSGGLNRSSARVGLRSTTGAARMTVWCGRFGSPFMLTLLARLPFFAVLPPHRYSFHPLIVPFGISASLLGSETALALMVASFRLVPP